MKAMPATPRRKLLGLLLVVSLTLVAHAPGLRGDFVRWDDNTHITQNPVIREINLHNLRVMFTEPVAKLYCPLTWLSFAVDCRIWGRDPFGYHLTNLLLHLGNTALVFVLIHRLLRDRLATALPVALLAAAIFGVHPLRVESVAWATERKDVLFVFFYLLGIGAYLKWRTEGRRSAYWLCFTSFILSALSKSAAVTFPLVALLLDRFWAGRVVWRDKIPLLIVSFIVGATTVMAQAGGTEGTVMGTDLVPLWARPGLVGSCTFFYVKMFLWPFHLCAVYPVFGEMRWTPVISGAFLIGFAGVTAAIWALRQRLPLLWPCWLFYLCTLSPTIGLLPVGMHIVADRYSYLPLIGLALPTAAGLVNLPQALSTPSRYLNWVQKAGIAALLVLLTILSADRSLAWADTETLFQNVLHEQPQCWTAYVKLGSWYRRLHQYDKAIAYGKQAVEIWPDGLVGIKNLAWSYQEAGQPHAALQVLRPVVQRGTDDWEIWLTLSECFIAEQQWSNALAALRSLARHPEADPTRIKALRTAAENHERPATTASPPE